MRHAARPLLCLALLAVAAGLAAARCPDGMRPIREGELSQAQIVGNIAFQSHAQQVCKLMPEIITSGGVKAYNIGE